MNYTKSLKKEHEIYRDNLIYKTGDNRKDRIFDFQKF